MKSFGCLLRKYKLFQIVNIDIAKLVSLIFPLNLTNKETSSWSSSVIKNSIGFIVLITNKL